MNTSLEICPHHPIASTSSGVAIEWDHTLQTGSVDRALFVFTEVATGNQTRYEVGPGIPICFDLIAGLYRVTVFAKGLEIYRSSLELQPGSATPFKPVLNPSIQETKTLKDILARFDISQLINTRDLEVPRNSTVVLDMQSDQFKSDWKTVEIKNVESMKRIIGNSDKLWGGNFPRNKPLTLSTQMNPEEVARQAAQEYFYGNSATVKKWAKVINDAIFSEVWRFPIFIYGTVTINAGGVLIIGHRGNFFVCERLRMHVTSTLLIRGSGPINVEPISFETFC
jgi:hypothetical protein